MGPTLLLSTLIQKLHLLFFHSTKHTLNDLYTILPADLRKKTVHNSTQVELLTANKSIQWLHQVPLNTN